MAHPRGRERRRLPRRVTVATSTARSARIPAAGRRSTSRSSSPPTPTTSAVPIADGEEPARTAVAGEVRPLRAQGDEARRADRRARRPHACARRGPRHRAPRRRVRAGRGRPPRRLEPPRRPDPRLPVGDAVMAQPTRVSSSRARRGRSGFPVAIALASEHEVIAVARFRDPRSAPARSRRCHLCRGRLRERQPRRGADRRRLRVQLRRREVESLGCRHRGQRRSRRSAHGALPQRAARSCTARRRASTKRPAAVRSSRRIRSATTTA